MINIVVFGKPQAFESYEYSVDDQYLYSTREGIHIEPLLKPIHSRDIILHYYVIKNIEYFELYTYTEGQESARAGSVFGVCLKTDKHIQLLEAYTKVLLPLFREFSCLLLEGDKYISNNLVKEIKEISLTDKQKETISSVVDELSISSSNKGLLLLLSSDFNKEIEENAKIIKGYNEVYIATNANIFSHPQNKLTFKEAQKRIYKIIEDGSLYLIGTDLLPKKNSAIAVSSELLTFYSKQGATITPQTVSITGIDLSAAPTVSGATDKFTITSNLTVAGGTIIVSPKNTLAVGTHEGAITITADGVSTIVSLRVTITAKDTKDPMPPKTPSITISSASLIFSGEKGTAIASQTVSAIATNLSAAPIVSGDTTKFIVTSSLTAIGGTITIAPKKTLAVGTHEDTITITADGVSKTVSLQATITAKRGWWSNLKKEIKVAIFVGVLLCCSAVVYSLLQDKIFSPNPPSYVADSVSFSPRNIPIGTRWKLNPKLWYQGSERTITQLSDLTFEVQPDEYAKVDTNTYELKVLSERPESENTQVKVLVKLDGRELKGYQSYTIKAQLPIADNVTFTQCETSIGSSWRMNPKLTRQDNRSHRTTLNELQFKVLPEGLAYVDVNDNYKLKVQQRPQDDTQVTVIAYLGDRQLGTQTYTIKARTLEHSLPRDTHRYASSSVIINHSHSFEHRFSLNETVTITAQSNHIPCQGGRWEGKGLDISSPNSNPITITFTKGGEFELYYYFTNTSGESDDASCKIYVNSF